MPYFRLFLIFAGIWSLISIINYEIYFVLPAPFKMNTKDSDPKNSTLISKSNHWKIPNPNKSLKPTITGNKKSVQSNRRGPKLTNILKRTRGRLEPKKNALIVSKLTSSLSLCSERATTLGGHDQKVVSFSLFQNKKKVQNPARYFPGILANYKTVQKYYPGWFMRLYTNLPSTTRVFQRLGVKKKFFICNVTKLPRLGNLSGTHGMVWRFFPIGDPLVLKFIVRDLDSVVGARERSAVQQWENSNRTFHAMRDHRLHNGILGGLWGAKNYLMSPIMRQTILDEFIQDADQTKVGEKWGADQDILNRVLYKEFRKLFMIHDAYNCKRNRDSIPFPVQREDIKSYVGRPVFFKLGGSARECPIECRPREGKNWTYC